MEIACGTPGGKKMKSCLHDGILAVDLHQALAFDDVIDLLLHLVAVRLDIGLGLIHRNAVVDVMRAGGVEHHQRL